MFFQSGVEFPSGFSNVAHVTVHSRDFMNGIRGVKGISFCPWDEPVKSEG